MQYLPGKISEQMSVKEKRCLSKTNTLSLVRMNTGPVYRRDSILNKIDQTLSALTQQFTFLSRGSAVLRLLFTVVLKNLYQFFSMGSFLPVNMNLIGMVRIAEDSV